MLSQLNFKIFGLQTVKEQYADDSDFEDIVMHCKGGKPWGKFHVNDGFLFRANKLCIPASSVRLLLLQEAHGGGLMGHFGVCKTQEILAVHFFWPQMRRDMERFVARCTTCQEAKSHLNNHEYGVSSSFNVADLKPYVGEDEELPSRTTLIQEGEDDEEINPDKGMATPTKPAQVPPGPLTRARARELNFVMILKNEGPEAS
jgi:hypothetical protein